MRRLPPLRSLQCFETAANHGSFSSAASELCVTHSAVSHQIRTLEAWFGKALFVRYNDGVRLTKEGDELRSACSVVFSRLEEECTRIRAGAVDRKLTVACSVSFLSHWLLPRIEGFSAHAPEVVLCFQTHGSVALLLERKIDALIVSGLIASFTDVEATCLAHHLIGPVCAPGWQRPPASAREVGGIPLLHAASRKNAWQEWAQAVGISIDLSHGQTLDSLSLTIEAARGGLGFAITPEFLVRRDLEDGKLIAPLGFARVERSTCLYVRAERDAQGDIAAFREWLLAESRAESTLSS